MIGLYVGLIEAVSFKYEKKRFGSKISSKHPGESVRQIYVLRPKIIHF